MSEEQAAVPAAPAAPLGDQELKEAVVALVSLGVFAEDAIKNKHVDFQKALVVGMKLKDGISGYQKVIPEALDLDSVEGLDICAAVAAELSIDNAKAKAVILASLKLAVALVAPVKELSDALKA